MRALILAGGVALFATAAQAQSLSVKGADGAVAELDAAAIAALPHLSLEVTDHEGKVHSYQGVEVRDVLATVGAPQGAAIRGPVLAQAIRFTAADGYQVVLSLAETDPTVQAAKVLVADAENGEPLAEADGPLRLVVEGDLRPARAARQLMGLEVLDLATGKAPAHP